MTAESLSRATLVRNGAKGLLVVSALGAIEVARAGDARGAVATTRDLELFALSVRAERLAADIARRSTVVAKKSGDDADRLMDEARKASTEKVLKTVSVIKAAGGTTPFTPRRFKYPAGMFTDEAVFWQEVTKFQTVLAATYLGAVSTLSSTAYRVSAAVRAADHAHVLGYAQAQAGMTPDFSPASGTSKTMTAGQGEAVLVRYSA